MVGWAFQLQDPRVILLLLLLVTAIALNLAGLFQLPMLTGGGRLAARGGMRRRLLHRRARRLHRDALHRPVHGRGAGRGPGPALVAGAGLVRRARPRPRFALPRCSASSRRLRRRLPKPGKWMATFQRILSVPMFLTALAPRLDPRPPDRRGRHDARPRRRAAARARPLVGRARRALVRLGADPRRRGRADAARPRRSRPSARAARKPAPGRAVQRGAPRPAIAPRTRRSSSISPPTGA